MDIATSSFVETQNEGKKILQKIIERNSQYILKQDDFMIETGNDEHSVATFENGCFKGQKFFAEMTNIDIWSLITKKCDLSDKSRPFEKNFTLKHDNIAFCPGICISENDWSRSFVLFKEYSKKTLFQLLKEKKEERFTWDQRINLAVQIARGLEYLHSQGVLYLNLTFENILVFEKKGEIIFKLTNNLLVGLEGLDENSEIVHLREDGNHPFNKNIIKIMPPQVFNSPRDENQLTLIKYNKRVDSYQFGVFLYQMVTGKEPWANETLGEIFAGNLQEKVVPRTNCPKFLSELCKRCLDHDESKRPKDGTEILTLLQQR